MGRSRTPKPPRRSGVNRRDFLKRAGAASAALGATPFLSAYGGAAGDGGRGGGRPGDGVFMHGVASGDPLADRVMLWTRVTQSATRWVLVRFEVAKDIGFTRIVRSGFTVANEHRDFTVKIDIDGLRPNTTYYYRFFARGFRSPIGRTKTLPVGSIDRLRLGVVVCSSLAHGYFNAYRRVAERADLDVVVHLGDYIYEYGSYEYGNVRAYEPAHEIVSLEDYRTRHAQYKRDVDLQEVHRQHPMIAIWDDHEFANNAYKTGAENHTEATEGPWDTRVANALKAYYEWMPTRVPDDGNLKKNNRSFRLGDLAELVMLEERVGSRDQQLPSNIGDPNGYFIEAGDYVDPSRQMLGVTEENWLSERLRRSRARWKLVGQGVMFAQLKAAGAPNAAGASVFINSDQWDGYQPARDRIYDVLKGGTSNPAVNNVVLLTGDIHSSWAADLTQDPNNPDLAAGGYNPATGDGSRAVEFVCTSVTSPGVDDPTGGIAAFLRSVNPHFKYIELTRRGYMLLDVTPERVSSEWWYVDTVAAPSAVQTFAVAYQVQHGSNRVTPATQTQPRPNPAPLAP